MKNKSLLVLTTWALMAAACGGDDAATTTTTTTPAPVTTSSTTTTTTEPEVAGVRFVGADGVVSIITDTSRIVSLNGDLTEIIFELGFGDSVVGVDVTTTYPPEAAALNDRGQTVGFGQQLAPEPVLRFSPTLVLGDTQIAPAETIEQLRTAGVPVVILELQTTLDGVDDKILQVAEILGVPDAGQELADRVSAEIAEARTLAAGAEAQPRVAFVYVRGPQTVFLFGAGTATNAMIEGANAIDAGAESGVFGPAPLTPEALVAAAPEVIVLPQSGLQGLGGVAAFLQIPGVAETPAGQSESFLAYDEAYFFNLGPRVGQALLEFVRDLHPELAAGS